MNKIEIVHTVKGWRIKAFKGYLNGFKLSPNQKVRLVIIPTKATDPTDSTIPDNGGIDRIFNGVMTMKVHSCPGAILGCYPDNSDEPLSGKYEKWTAQNYTLSYPSDIRISGGTGNNTVHDIVTEIDQIAQLVQAGSSIAFVSDYEHARRVALSLYSLGYEPVWIDSTSTMDRAHWKELVLFIVGWIDPLWQGPLGTFLTYMAQKEADAYRATT